jgi:signal transduction histidine kinase
MSQPHSPSSKEGKSPRFFLGARPLQAGLEAWLLGGLLLAGLLALQRHLRTTTLIQGVFFLSGGAALWCAMRINRSRHATRSRRWARELSIAVGLSASLTVGWGLATWFLWGQIPSDTAGRTGVAALLLMAGGAEFLVFRAGVGLWQWWLEQCQRRLLWSLTHMQIQVVVLFALLFVALFVGTLFVLGYLPSRAAESGGVVPVVTSLILTILPLLSVALAATLAVLAVILPPTVVFAYLLSRRTTRRLEALAKTAAALREGDTGARVQVQGEDEVAQLQAAFNAMASDMEGALRDLEVERDRVATLLQNQRELVASVSHELRTPVATIRGHLESSKAGRDGALPEALARDLEIVHDEVARLQGLIDDLFALARAEAGGLRLEIQPTDAGAVIGRRVEAMAPLAWQSGRVEVTAEVPPDLPLVRADEGRLEQVLVNLLRNSVQHTLPGGIVQVAASADEEWMRIEVRDTGEGIATEDLPHIWNRFYRGAQPNGAAKGGTGLGLALVKELTEAMGGTVAVESAVGEGSCFTVRLPRA